VHGFGYAFEADAAEEGPERRPERAGAQIEWERGVLQLMEGENVIGRGEEVAVRIDVDGVSRRHARIVADGGRFTLEDLGSKNGTYLRELRLEGPVALEDGAAFRLGRTMLVFSVPRGRGMTVTED
jgi:pSer/pThr/pTyr-binding forkhead associated (FHA) protein